MDQFKFLKTVIFILVLINIGSLAFMWMQNHRHGRPHPPEIGKYLNHELHFTSAQMVQFDELRDEHRNKIDELRNKSRHMHDAFFEQLHQPVDSVKINQMADSMVVIQREIELATFYHFQKVRMICTPEQQKKFDRVINEALRMMAPGPPGPPEHH